MPFSLEDFRIERPHTIELSGASLLAGQPDIPAIDRVPTGVPGLDEHMQGGFPRGSAFLIAGGPGACKTTFGVQWIYTGAKVYNEPGLVISFDEAPQKLKANMGAYGWNLTELEKKRLCAITHVNPLQVEQFAKQESILIGDLITTLGAKRVFLDSLTSFEIMFQSDYERRVYTTKLIDEILKHGATLLISSEASGEELSKFGMAEFISDGVMRLSLDLKRDPPRQIEILKMRGTQHAHGPLPLVAGPNGLHLKGASPYVLDKPKSLPVRPSKPALKPSHRR